MLKCCTCTAQYISGVHEHELLKFSCLNILHVHPAGVIMSTCTPSHHCQSPVRIPHIKEIRKLAAYDKKPCSPRSCIERLALAKHSCWIIPFWPDLEWRNVTFCTQPSWTQRKQRENNANPNSQWNVNILEARRKESCHMRRTNARPRSRLSYTHGQLINWIHAFQLAHLDS